MAGQEIEGLGIEGKVTEGTGNELTTCDRTFVEADRHVEMYGMGGHGMQHQQADKQAGQDGHGRNSGRDNV